jgi:hypothetical protein
MACLALICKSLYITIDLVQVFQRLDCEFEVVYPIHEQLRDFLLLCTRDDAQYYLCHRCYKLHIRARVSPSGSLYHT